MPPLMASTKGEPPMPKQITQFEITAVLAHYGAALRAALELRKRIGEGATAERGPYAVRNDENDIPAADYDPDMTEGLHLCGLDIELTGLSTPQENGLTVHH